MMTLLLLLLLLPPPPVTSQGLSISPEQLGAGEAAVVDQFSRFEEILDLASQSIGGRGKGGRSGTTSATGGTSFRTVKSLQQLQLATYYLAGSPPIYNSWNTSQNLGGISLLPGVRDQLNCDSCVAQAIAAAIQAATAAAYRQNADQAQFNVSAASLYYCSEGGKTCKTGWDLQEALAMTMDKLQFLIRPTSCARKTSSRMLDKPTSEPQVFDWKPVCQEAEQACSSVSNRALPWLSCTYKSLSSFVDIQRHIRQHGAVLTRITIYDDFWKHFNITFDGGMPKATVHGATHKAYNRTTDSRSKPLFGHAAVIVGYNNSELTWTLLNSYGTQRFTLDGLFKVAMGVAGVAVPDQTFGIECKPTPGGPDDLHFTDWLTPWIADPALRPRKPVDYWDRAKDWNNLNTSCYRYNMTAQDTISSTADAFGVSLQQLVRDNQALFPVSQVNYTLKTGTQLADLEKVAAVANKLRLDNGIEPFFVCRIYTGQTWMSSRTCRQSDLAPCAGAWGCKIVYSEADVSVLLAPGTPLKVCGISRVAEAGAFDRTAYLKEPRDSQPRALKAVLQALQGPWQDVQDSVNGRDCYTTTSSAICDKADGIVTTLFLDHIPKRPLRILLGKRAVYALLSLERLSNLEVVVTGGTLPPQLGALDLAKLSIDTICSARANNWGSLPDNWFLGPWRKSLTSLTISPPVQEWDFADNGGCGVTGPLPGKWFQATSALVQLDLSRNQLSGSLPSELAKVMRRLGTIKLSHNSFTGTIPLSLASTSMLFTYMFLDFNKLTGPVPLGLGALYLKLDNNPGLQGCVSEGTYANTGITGPCEPDAGKQWWLQLRALDVTLAKFLGVPVNISHLPATPYLFFAEHPDAASTPDFDYRYNMNDDEACLRVINGLLCITELKQHVSDLSGNRLSPVNMTVFPELLRQLPCLTSLSVSNRGPKLVNPDTPISSSTAGRYQLPADLPTAAPSLERLTLTGCGLSGTTPDWKNWTGLALLDLHENFLVGTLPEWRDMKQLINLDLGANQLSSTLPAAWAEAMPALSNSFAAPGTLYAAPFLGLSDNPGINGSIPAAWWHRFNNIIIDLQGTSLSGCKPGWQGGIYWPNDLAEAPLCGQDEAALLQQAQQLLQTSIPSQVSTWQSGESGSGSSTLPAHCRTWQGITCNINGQVIGMDMSSSSLQGAVISPLNLAALLQPLAGLLQLKTLKLHNNPRLFAGSTIPSALNWSAWSKLQHLDVSNCGLTGSLPESLGDLSSLVHLNTSYNPGMTGSLPEMLSATSLATLDVFECGLSGQLPKSFMALPLQLLRVGSAVRPSSADGSISGPLPASYGIIDTLRELQIVNTWVTGSIPTAWFDPAEAVAAAAAAAGAAAASIGMAATASGKAAGGTAMTRMAVVWQGVQDKLITQAGIATAAAAAPAGNGLSMQQLEVLDVSGNTLLEASPLPIQLATLKQLKVLRLSSGKLTGQLPDSFGRLSQLQQLDLSGNQLSGTIPVSWLGLRSLSVVDLSGNPAIGGAIAAPLYRMADPEHSLRCLRLCGTGVGGQWTRAGGLMAVKEKFEGLPGSQVKVAISSETPEC